MSEAQGYHRRKEEGLCKTSVCSDLCLEADLLTLFSQTATPPCSRHSPHSWEEPCDVHQIHSLTSFASAARKLSLHPLHQPRLQHPPRTYCTCSLHTGPLAAPDWTYHILLSTQERRPSMWDVSTSLGFLWPTCPSFIQQATQTGEHPQSPQKPTPK